MKSKKQLSLTGLVVLSLLLCSERAYAHVPLYLVPIVGGFVFLPVALLSTLLGWLVKGLYFSDRTGLRMSKATWLAALMEAVILYGCFMLAAIIVEVGMKLAARWWWLWWWFDFPWDLRVTFALTVVFSALLSRFLQARFLNTIQKDSDRQSSAIARNWLTFLLGLVAPVIFSVACDWLIFFL